MILANINEDQSIAFRVLKVWYKLMLHDNPISTSIQSLQNSHQIMHGKMHSSLNQILLQLLIVYKACMLPIDKIKKTLWFMS